jgi:GH25 family lysozyme M1 (1,4-beta-N-acetylmuramidase)
LGDPVGEARRARCGALKGEAVLKTGADLSHHQERFDAARYKDSGEDFVILKASDWPRGRPFTDPTFRTRWRDAGRHRLPRAGYHFGHPASSMADQADHFIDVVRDAGWRAGDAWALDMERAERQRPAQIVDWSSKWVARVRAALGGVGLFYSGVGFIVNELGGPGRVPGGALSWVARYNRRIDHPWVSFRRPAGWPQTPAVWQRTDGSAGLTKSVASVGTCDHNHMTEAAFARLFATDDLTTDELLAALESPRGQRILRDATTKAVGPEVIGVLRTAFAGHAPKPVDPKTIRASQDWLFNTVAGIKTKVDRP